MKKSPIPMTFRDRDREVLSGTEQAIERSRKLLRETAPLLRDDSAAAPEGGPDED